MHRCVTPPDLPAPRYADAVHIRSSMYMPLLAFQRFTRRTTTLRRRNLAYVANLAFSSRGKDETSCFSLNLIVTYRSTPRDPITNESQAMRRPQRLPRAARSFLGGADHDVNRRCAFTLPIGWYISCAGCDPTEFQVRREVSMVTILMMTFILICSPSDVIDSTLTDDHETYSKDASVPSICGLAKTFTELQ